MIIQDNDKLILITNDDGLYAAGLKTLTGVMKEFGKVVVISATESRSGDVTGTDCKGTAEGQAP